MPTCIFRIISTWKLKDTIATKVLATTTIKAKANVMNNSTKFQFNCHISTED